MTKGVALSVAACVLLVGCGSATSSSGVPAAGAPVPELCSSKPVPNLPPNRWDAAHSVLAPTGARSIRLCRYSGLDADPRLALVSSRLLTGSALVAELVGEFDRLPALPPGAFSCPADDGSRITAMLAYPAGHEVRIAVGLTGCTLVTNGVVRRTAAGLGTSPTVGPRLVAELERLVSGRSRAGSGPAGADALAHGAWSLLARSPLGTRHGAAVVWDGRELLELGGTAEGRPGGAPEDSGAAYNPAQRRWRRVAGAPTAVLPVNAVSVWTGRQVFVFGGPTLLSRRAVDVAGLYDPAGNRWTVTSAAPVGPFSHQPTAVWTGRIVILAGFSRARPQQLQLAGYDPRTNAWASLAPPANPDHPPLDDAIVATNHGVLLWWLWGRSEKTGPNTYAVYSGVDVFLLSPAGTWANVTGRWPQHHTVDEPLFTGSKILVAPGQIWCGTCSHPAPFGEHGYFVDPLTLRISPIPHGPFDDLGPQVLWTGAAEISFNAGDEISGPGVSVLPGDVAIWNPSTRRWTRGPRAPRPIGDQPAVWSGRALYVLARDGTLLAYEPSYQGRRSRR